MYVCGATVQGVPHIGHVRGALNYDVLRRWLLHSGLDVLMVRNVTDIDDPLLERAERDNDDWMVLGMRETALFREDMEALRVLPPQEHHRVHSGNYRGFVRRSCSWW